MSIDVLVMRHALSEANNWDNIGTPAHYAKNAPLMPKGREQARAKKGELITEYGINPEETAAAVSTLERSPETGREVGFAALRVYSLLDEFDPDDPKDWPLILKDLAKGRCPQELLEEAYALLSNPPEEKVWISHGVKIAGIAHALGGIKFANNRPYPGFCEITELHID